MSGVLDGEVNFFCTTVMTFENRPRMQQDIGFIVVRYFDESVAAKIKDESKHSEYVVRKQFHGSNILYRSPKYKGTNFCVRGVVNRTESAADLLL